MKARAQKNTLLKNTQASAASNFKNNLTSNNWVIKSIAFVKLAFCSKDIKCWSTETEFGNVHK